MGCSLSEILVRDDAVPTGARRRGPKGRVTTLVQERVASVGNLAVYLCGNGDMIKEVTELVQGKGLCPIYREKYY